MYREKERGQNPGAHGQRAEGRDAKEAKKVWLERKEEMWVAAGSQKAR